LDNLIKNDIPYDVAFKIKRTDDGRFLNIRSIAEYHKTNNLVFGVIIDLTQHETAKQALKESEERFKLLSDVTFEGIVLHKDGIILDVNSSFERLTGYAKEDAVGQNLFSALVREEDILKARHNIVKEHAKPYEVSALKKDGTFFWAEIEGRKLIHNDDEIRIVAVRDITEKVETKSALQESEQKFQTYIQASPTSVFIADENGKYTFVNPAAANLLGYSEEELLQMSISDILPESELENGLSNFNEVKSRGRSHSSEIRFIRKDGKIVDITIEAVKLSENQFIAFCKEITDLKDIQHQLEERNTELNNSLEAIKTINTQLDLARSKAEESDHLKSVFLTTMSHELRTPLNAIIGFSELISENFQDDETGQYSKIINKNGRNLLSIIEDTFELSLIDSGQVKIYKETFTLGEYFDELNATISSLVRNFNKADLKVEFRAEPGSLHNQIITDRQKLTQVLLNLVKNSLKFTNHGYIKYGYFFSESNKIVFYVKDTGIGIAPEKQDIIFERFRQVDDSTTRTYGGTGLGLSICSEIMKLLDGKIWVESTPGAGSTFYFSIDPGINVKETQLPHTTEVISNETPDFSSFKILVAEDNYSNLEFIKILLLKTGAQFYHAENGNEVLDILSHNPDTDLILMDLKMPEMDGYAATKKIRESGNKIPIIALTALAFADNREKAFEAGCDDYITKPINKQELYKKLLEFLG
nr:PAS domain S-box protein [Bacteroidota bacterium]